MTRRMLHLLRAAAALGALVVLVAGIPAALAATVGNPLQAWPDLLAGDLSDRVIVAVLAAVAWVAWAQFAVAVVLELLTALAGVRVPLRVPGLLPSQRQLAHVLVAAAFALAPLQPTGAAHAQTAPVPSAVAVVASMPVSIVAPATASAPAVPVERDAVPETSERTMYTVRDDGPGTYWDLAEHFLGDGTRWQQIWQLNEGRQQADGSRMTSPGLLRPGWTVLLPADATGADAAGAEAPAATQEVTVRRGDTLSSIAADHDVDWQQLWTLNEGRAQPDGRRFTDPDVIVPGWSLDVPAGQAASPSTKSPVPPAALDPADPPGVVVPLVPAPPVPVQASAPDEKPRDVVEPAPVATSTPVARTEAPAPATPAAGERATPSESTSPESASPDPASSGEASSRETSSGNDAAVLAATLFGAGGLLLAGVSAEALRRHRRRQQRYRRPGRAIAATPSALVQAERAVSAGAGVVDVRWLNEALRGLVHQQVGIPDAVLPDVLAARLSSEELELVLATPALQAPGAWAVDGTGTRWTLRRDASTGFDPAAGRLAPYPTLASVGYVAASGDQWLLDLERVGSLALSGDQRRCLDLARFVAAELAHNTWSEQLAVTVSGFGAEIVGINPDRVAVSADPEAAVTRSVTQLRSVQWALSQARTDVLSARLRDVAADMVFPHVVLLADLPADDEDLGDALAPLLDSDPERGRTAAALVLTGPGADTRQAHWQVTVDRDGVLHLPQLGLDLVAQQLPAAEAAQLAQLLAVVARTDDRPMPDAAGDAGWTGLADLAGAPRPDLLSGPRADTTVSKLGPTTDSSDSVDVPPSGQTDGQLDVPVAVPATSVRGAVRPADPGPAPVRADRVLPLPPATYLDHTATTGEDLQTLAPPVVDDVRQQVQDADPTLEEDLAAWAAPQCPRPRLSVLGPLMLRAGADPGTEHHRRAWTTEVVAYLASRPRGVTAEQLAADLWPNDPHATMTSKVRQTIYMIRKRLGADPQTGVDYVPTAVNPTGGPGLYRIDGMLVDADLFRRLRLRGVARGADGIGDLQAALDLVTGPPFTDRRPGGYAWLADDPLDHTYTAMIVDVAHVVATHHLAAGRPELAAAAAQVALTAGSTDDVALLDLVAACDAQGHRAEADRLVQRILANHDAEVEEDLPPRTAEILHRRHWLDRAG